MEKCTARNGSYCCRFEKGHDGAHVSRFYTAMGWKLAIFADNYSPVEVINSRVQSNVR